jgi:predicted AlkP superfamily phosphohydrolase/phosphomutase
LGFTPENLYPIVQRLGFLTMRVKKKVDPRRMGRKSLVRRVFLSYNDVDWARTKAFTMGGMGQIYVNVKGRHAQGCVEPGEEYDRVIDMITSRLPEIKLPNSDQPFVKTAFRRDDLYHGEHVETMPDIVIFPTDMGYLDLGVEFASNQLFTKIDAVSGGHRTNGVFVLTGAKVKGAQELKGVSIRDIAPTALHLLGLAVPDDMDGRVLTEALQVSFLAENPIRTISAAEVAEKTSQNGFASDEDEARIRERLAGLGYLD